MKKYLLLFILSLSFQLLIAQDYNLLDDKVNQYPKQFHSIESLAKRISSDFTTDIDKTRALFYWLSNNITYDNDDANDGKGTYKRIKLDKNYKTKLTEQQIKYANRCLRKQMAVCEGYSQIMKHTLDILDIECEVISGYAKKNAREIGRVRNTSNHAWNAVKLNNEWQLIDATWSAGEYNSQAISTYFLIQPEQLILSHLPKDSKWQLLDKPITKSKFFFRPVIFYTYYTSGLKLNKNQIGLLKVKTGEKIKLVFSKINETISYRYEFKNQPYTSPLKFKKEKDNYAVEIAFNETRNSELTIYSNNTGVLEFKILVAK
ncbi:transglutaminase domain-containing protein [Lacinutrix sp. Bg11-31]|uniref:transglutaminase domain-containing protein n=1 Tax=Lacinutrix sp. Bg11-31 TaxID=2057808 RepID=UPI0012FD3518|nr:transglutaminase domain-containing protein [Lacinutrix sp. Bg11-31]